MGLLTGNVSCTRFNIIGLPDEIDFESQAFQALRAGSAIKERAGFVPFELEEPYVIGTQRWAFRVRIDKVTADRTLVIERYRELLKVEEAEVGPPSPKTKRDLRKLAEEEIESRTAPRSRIFECIIDQGVLYAATTTNSQLDILVNLLKKVGVSVEYKAPWVELGQEETSSIVDSSNPGESVLGCQFLKKILEDPTVYVEPQKGSARLITPEGTKVSLSGTVIGELNRYLDEGAELLSAKLIVNEIPIRFVGLSYQISGMKVESFHGDHWTEVLDERMEPIMSMWQLLDEKYIEVMNSVQSNQKDMFEDEDS